MKWIGALILICTTTWIGFDMSNRLGDRTKQIRQFILSLQMIEAEVVYSQLTLQDIFHTVSNKTAYPINEFYRQMTHKLSDVVTDFLDVWDEALNRLMKVSALKKNEQEIIKQFGRSLGQHSSLQQQKHIALAIHHLERELDEALEQRDKYEKMMRSLGVLIGIFIVLILF
ncbi:stage III sporulation protein SpoIIIAB [Pseudogracilibacillus sp. SE30717A]|uniref:stage III sporulation protein SpoIIIAB n=1 Tax=Pseudogracilibacillus sp. SE30717A TaxID=3098293 RepID=UPI00300DF4A5